jgi:D-glycero-D-manno-heptose 1,7-bisphosphate phosphatase
MKLVILDRDGVINRDSDEYIKTPEEWEPLPGSLEAIARLTQAGFHITVATNQSGIARGLFDMATLNAIHARMHKAVNQAGGRIEAIFYCPDLPDTDSSCRKPNPGMFHAIAERYDVSLERVPAVGDKLSDLHAAFAVGAQPILVLTGRGEQTRAGGDLPQATLIYPDLAAVAQVLCAS